MKRLRVKIVTPWGASYDLSDRVDMDGVGTLEEALDDELLSNSHGDITLEFADADGFVSGLFRGADPADRWEVTVDRETGQRRPKWCRVFGGVIDLPWSVEIDTNDKTVSVEAFSWSKVLERGSADEIIRTFSAMAASITIDTKAMTLNVTSPLMTGDRITLMDSSRNTQTFTVEKVTSSTALTTVEDAERTFSSVAVVVETPYYRDKTPAYLADLVFAASDVDDYQVTLDEPAWPYPIATPLARNGLPLSAFVRSLTIESGAIGATTSQSPRRTATSPTSGWSDGTASTTAQADWTPYVASEPTIRNLPAAAPVDNGLYCWRSGSTKFYTLVAGGSFPGNAVLEIEDEAEVTVWAVDTYAKGASGDTHQNYAIEWDPVGDGFWVCYERSTGARMALEFVDRASGTQTDIETDPSLYIRGLRCCISLNAMVAYSPIAGLRVYDLTSKALVAKAPLPDGCNALVLWTLREFDGYVACLGLDASSTATRCFIWNDSWEFLGSFPVSPSRIRTGPYEDGSTIMTGFVTVYTDADNRKVGIGSMGGEWFVLSRYWDGVIPYADFDGLSCAAALDEIAKVALGYVHVSPYGNGKLTFRKLPDRDTAPLIQLDDPLDEKIVPVWESYRGSVAVMTKTDDGDEFEAIAGDRGDSARRLDLDARLATSPAMANAAAAGAFAFLGVLREQRDVTVPEGRRLARPLDLVEMRGRRYAVIEATSDLADEEQDLRLVEV